MSSDRGNKSCCAVHLVVLVCMRPGVCLEPRSAAMRRQRVCVWANRVEEYRENVSLAHLHHIFYWWAEIS